MVTFKFRNATIKGSGKYLLAAVWPQRWQLGAANEGKSSKKKEHPNATRLTQMRL
jgi:hypothetical protein